MLGETVRNTRIKKGLTQAKLARLAGVSRRHLAALEKGANVSVLVLKKVASVLDLTEINLGPLLLHAAKDPSVQVNMPLLAETIREAHADALRAQSLLAEAEGMMDNGRRRAAKPPAVRFPKMPVRRLGGRRRALALSAVADAVENAGIKVSAEIRHGEEIQELKGDTAAMPSSLIEKGEIVFRARGETLRHEGIEDGDLLVVQIRPKGRAASGELVICKIGETIYVGRWWQKHGRRALLTDGPSEVITGTAKGSLKVMAAINAIVRPEK